MVPQRKAVHRVSRERAHVSAREGLGFAQGRGPSHEAPPILVGGWSRHFRLLLVHTTLGAYGGAFSLSASVLGVGPCARWFSRE